MAIFINSTCKRGGGVAVGSVACCGMQFRRRSVAHTALVVAVENLQTAYTDFDIAGTVLQSIIQITRQARVCCRQLLASCPNVTTSAHTTLQSRKLLLCSLKYVSCPVDKEVSFRAEILRLGAKFGAAHTQVRRQR